MSVPTYPNPEQTNNTTEIAFERVVSNAATSPITLSTHLIKVASLGDGYVDQLSVNKPGDIAALNFYMKKYTCSFNGVVVQNVDELKKQIAAA